jgi:transcriptional regulator with XRE-family HTH domain
MQDDPSPLARYRDAAGQTLEELGTAFGVDKSTMLRWEKGRVPVDRLRDVERVTGLSRRVLRPDIYEDDEAAA